MASWLPRTRRAVAGWVVGAALVVAVGTVLFSLVSASGQDAGTDRASSVPVPESAGPTSGSRPRTPAPPSTAPPGTAPPAAPSPRPGTGGAPGVDDVDPHRADVELAGCNMLHDANLMFSMLTVTNSAQHPSSYIIQIQYNSREGSVLLGEGLVFVLDVDPGESVVVEDHTFAQIPGVPFVCDVGSVDRYRV